MEKNAELQVAFQDLWDVIKKMTAKMETFHKKRNDLQSQIDFLSDTIATKNNKIDELEEKNNNLQNIINDKNARITDQHTEIDSLLVKQKKLINTEQLYSNVVNENDNLKKELAILSDKCLKLNELEISYNELKLAQNALLTENVDLKQKSLLLDNTLKNHGIAQNEIRNIKHEIINRNEEINKLKISLSEQESLTISKNNELQKILAEKTNLSNEIIALREEVAKLNTQSQTVEENFLQKEIKLESDKLTYVAVIEHLKQEILDYDKQKQVLEKSFVENENNDAKLLKTLNNNAILQQELTEVKTHNKALYAEIDTLKQQILTYDADFTEDRDNKNNEIKEILAETEQLTEIVAKLTGELENSKTDSERIYLENKDLTLKVDTLQNEINKAEKLSKAIEKMKQSNKEQASTIFELQAELTSYKQRIYDEDSLFADMHKLEFIDNAEQHKLEIAQLSQQNTELNNKNNELVKRVNELEHKELEFIQTNKKEEQLVVNKKANIGEKDEVVNKISSFLERLEQRM